jgi:hypothetical protein
MTWHETHDSFGRPVWFPVDHDHLGYIIRRGDGKWYVMRPSDNPNAMGRHGTADEAKTAYEAL